MLKFTPDKTSYGVTDCFHKKLPLNQEITNVRGRIRYSQTVYAVCLGTTNKLASNRDIKESEGVGGGGVSRLNVRQACVP